MSRALYAGLSGTLAHQAALDVLANNLANVHTVGYKERRAKFADCFYQTLCAGRAAQGGLGVNPMQVGTGARVASIAVLHTQGAIEATGQPLDAAIEGPGFFVVSDGQRQYLTRDGTFTLDSAGTLVLASTGVRVLGWMADQAGNIDSTGPAGPITVPLGWVRPGVATSAAACSGNLDASSQVGDSVYCTRLIYDSLGLQHLLELTFTKTDVNTWQVSARCEGSAAQATLQFDADGQLASGSSLDLSITLTNGAHSPQAVSIDLGSVTQRAAASNPMISAQNGRGTAALQEVALQNDGLVQGKFSDGTVVILGCLAMGNVANPGGLEALSNNLYAAGPASGAVEVGRAGTGNRGHIVAQGLELSTVDVTRAFVDLIATQRGFQANTRVISAANEMLEDVMRILR
jgi:flagellar hook protein FlgE